MSVSNGLRINGFYLGFIRSFVSFSFVFHFAVSLSILSVCVSLFPVCVVLLFMAQVMAAEELAAFARSRGGTRQQADRFEQQHWQSQRLPTKLAEVLLELWRWGRLPATLVQRIAAAAEQDLRNAYDKKLDEWSTLARLGAYGQHTGNIRRDLMAKLPRPFAEVFRLHLFVCVFVYDMPVFILLSDVHCSGRYLGILFLFVAHPPEDKRDA